MLARVQVEHEVDQRARQPGPSTEQDREPRAGHLRRPLEVENAERRTEIPVRLRLEIERAAVTPRAHNDVVCFAFADGTLACGMFGSAISRLVR